MRTLRIVSGGSEHGSARRPPALGVCDLRPRSVRQGGSRLAELYRAIEWDYVRLVVGSSVAVFVAVYVALGRMR